MTEGIKLSIVDDEVDIASFIGEVAGQLGYDVTCASSAKSFLNQLDQGWTPDVLILDVVMPECDGIELIRKISQRGLHPKIIGISGYNPLYLDLIKFIADESGLAYVDSIGKPITIEALEAILRRVAHEFEVQEVA